MNDKIFTDMMNVNLKRGEKITVVKNNITGDEYCTSNLYSKQIDGIEFVGVFSKSADPHRRKINWVRKDHLVKVK